MDLSVRKCACCGIPINKVSARLYAGKVFYQYMPGKKYCDSVCQKFNLKQRKAKKPLLV